MKGWNGGGVEGQGAKKTKNSYFFVDVLPIYYLK